MMVSPFDELSAIAHDVYVFRYTTVAVLIYDYTLTLNDEIRLVWKSRISFIKCVYCLNRAAAFVSVFLQIYLLLINSDSNSCKRLLYVTASVDLSIFIIGEIVLFMRVYAIWLCNRAMLVLFVGVYVPGHVGAIYATMRATKSATAETVPILFGNGCLVSYSSRGFWICYFILLVHETLMLSLILLKAFNWSGYSISRVLQMVVKDGVFYYICVLALSITNLLFILLATQNLRIFMILPQGMLHSILCARLLLRLRGAYEQLTSTGLKSARFRTQSATLVGQDELIPMSVFSTSVP